MMADELEFHRWLRGRAEVGTGVDVSIGDDGAVCALPEGTRMVLVADAIAEGSHFLSDDAPELVGRKALARNLSDIAAMGATPLYALATAALPRGCPDDVPRRITTGMLELAREFGVRLVGGDTVSHDGKTVLSVTVVGSVAPGAAVLRSGARPGDVVVVTGRLGGSFPHRHLRFTPRVVEARSLVALGPPSAMMDLSDGMALDLRRLCEASGVGADIEAARIPVHPDVAAGPEAIRHALEDGEDYELLFTIGPDAWESVRASWPHEVPLTAVGRITAGALRLVSEGGVGVPWPRGGHVHT